jgi:hypothetical protein
MYIYPHNSYEGDWSRLQPPMAGCYGLPPWALWAESSSTRLKDMRSELLPRSIRLRGAARADLPASRPSPKANEKRLPKMKVNTPLSPPERPTLLSAAAHSQQPNTSQPRSQPDKRGQPLLIKQWKYLWPGRIRRAPPRRGVNKVWVVRRDHRGWDHHMDSLERWKRPGDDPPAGWNRHLASRPANLPEP